MNKQIEYSNDARRQLLDGIDLLANAVTSTLGPNGRNVVYRDETGEVRSTKDGVTVAKVISLKDPVQSIAIDMLKQAAINTANSAGDGTTTATLLAQSITTEEQLKQIASISANNDEMVGNLITSALDAVGRDGIVTIEESKTGETYLETVEGIQFDRGYKSPYFVNDNSTMAAVLDSPYILIYDGKLSQAKDLLPVLESVSSENKSLLIICEDIDNEALATLIVNKMRGTLKVAAVKAPDFGDRRKLIMEDIAILTGGEVISPQKGMKLSRLNRDWFGSARKANIQKENSIIIDGKGDTEAIDKRIDELKTQIDNAKTPFETEKLQERLGKFTGGVSIIHVGGSSELEMKETKDRVEDSLHATRAAIEQGIVPGGGSALLHASTALKGDTLGSKLVKDVCSAPFTKILSNAGFESSEIDTIMEEVLEAGAWNSYHVHDRKIVNMKDAGILDPFKVTRNALENAASVSGTILLTECVVADEPEEGGSPAMGMPNGMDPQMLMG